MLKCPKVRSCGRYDAESFRPFIRREDFFSTFAAVLEQHEDVSECVPIPDAYTPIIKLKMRGIDLLFARLARSPEAQVAEEVGREDEVLKNMDDKSVGSTDGIRVQRGALKRRNEVCVAIHRGSRSDPEAGAQPGRLGEAAEFHEISPGFH
eukprot:Skav226030  [mRNA]  locus=scaffold2502:54307:58108:+ [translate_table: standard]